MALGFGEQQLAAGLQRAVDVREQGRGIRHLVEHRERQREINLARARASRDVARAIREDLERGVAADVTFAYDTFITARATQELDRSALLVAQENFRVQGTRYRAGASTILDLLEAQDQLTLAEASLVRSRYATRFAVAGLEVILGRRLLNDRMEP